MFLKMVGKPDEKTKSPDAANHRPGAGTRGSACIPRGGSYYRTMPPRRAIPLAPTCHLLVAALVSLWMLGCQAPPQPAMPTEVVLHIPDYEAFVDASVSLLRRFDFAPERVDRARGLVVTAPATSGQWFEPWRVDSQGAYQVLESSLHTIRRHVTVRITPLDNAPATQPTVADVLTEEWDRQPDLWNVPRYRVGVQVDKERFATAPRQITTASGALSIYSIRIPTTEGVRGRASRSEEWVPLGRDPLLESFLIENLADAVPTATIAAMP